MNLTANFMPSALQGMRREVKDLPDGAMIEHEGMAYAVKGSHLLQWSHSQYGLAIPRASLMKARLLTPPLITAILAKGYQPRWHPSATPALRHRTA